MVHRFTANWRRLHVRVGVVHCSREEVSKLLHSFVLKTFGDYGEQDITWKIISYAQLKSSTKPALSVSNIDRSTYRRDDSFG